MSELPAELRTNFLETTDAHERIKNSRMLRLLGESAYLAALDQEREEQDKLSSVSYEDAYLLFADDVDSETTLADVLDEARNDFDDEAQRLFGEIDGYRLGYADPGQLALIKPYHEDDPGMRLLEGKKYFRLRVRPDEDGKLLIEKTLSKQRTPLHPEYPPVTEEDLATVGEAISRLNIINDTLSQEG